MPQHHRRRREFLRSAGLSCISLLAPAGSWSKQRMRDQANRELLLYVGTYTSGKSKGIYLYRFNLATGEMRHFRTVSGVVNPSFLTIDPQRRTLYAVNETSEFNGKPGGAVSAFAINQQSGALSRLNQRASLGGAPCHLTLDRTGKSLLIANYESGNVAVLRLRRDGSLGAATAMVQHRGASINVERQQGPHAHC